MPTVVNLRQARKHRARVVAEAQATEQRVKYGLPKSTQRRIMAEQALEARQLDGHRRDAEPDPDGA